MPPPWLITFTCIMSSTTTFNLNNQLQHWQCYDRRLPKKVRGHFGFLPLPVVLGAVVHSQTSNFGIISFLFHSVWKKERVKLLQKLMKRIEMTFSLTLASSVWAWVCYSLWGESDRHRRHLHRSQLKDLSPTDCESMETATEFRNSLKRWSNVFN